MTNGELDELERLAKEATAVEPGKWCAIPCDTRLKSWSDRPPIFPGARFWIMPQGVEERLPIVAVDKGDDHYEPTRLGARPLAQFIAAANPVAILELIQLVRDAQATR